MNADTARACTLGITLALTAFASQPVRGQATIFDDGFESGDTSAWETCDPDGTFALTAPAQISYSCCFGLVDVDITQFVLSNDATTVTSAPSSSGPAPMMGSGGSCPDVRGVAPGSGRLLDHLLRRRHFHHA